VFRARLRDRTRCRFLSGPAGSEGDVAAATTLSRAARQLALEPGRSRSFALCLAAQAFQRPHRAASGATPTRTASRSPREFVSVYRRARHSARRPRLCSICATQTARRCALRMLRSRAEKTDAQAGLTWRGKKEPHRPWTSHSKVVRWSRNCFRRRLDIIGHGRPRVQRPEESVVVNIEAR